MVGGSSQCPPLRMTGGCLRRRSSVVASLRAPRRRSRRAAIAASEQTPVAAHHHPPAAARRRLCLYSHAATPASCCLALHAEVGRGLHRRPTRSHQLARMASVGTDKQLLVSEATSTSFAIAAMRSRRLLCYAGHPECMSELAPEGAQLRGEERRHDWFVRRHRRQRGHGHPHRGHVNWCTVLFAHVSTAGLLSRQPLARARSSPAPDQPHEAELMAMPLDEELESGSPVAR